MHPAYFGTRFRVDNLPDRWPAQFVILSAWATTGQQWTQEQNEAADHGLARWLVDHGWWHHRVIGYSPRTGHAEPSWAFPLPLDEACELGLQFQQDALYYVDGDELYVTHCDQRRSLQSVGLFRQRIDPAPSIAEDSVPHSRSQKMLVPQQLPLPNVLSDQALARRLERAEAMAGAAWVQTRASMAPEVGATWIDVAGAYAIFDGPESPLTQTFGLGLFDDIGDAELEQFEAFFQRRDAPVFHNVSPLAAPNLIAQFHGRGYRPLEFDNVLVRPLTAPTEAQDAAIQVRRIGEEDVELSAQTAADGWSSDAPEYKDFIKPFALLSARTAGVHCFLACRDGQPIATGSLHLHSDVALLAGASTIPAARGQGAQLALMQGRLSYAAEHGAELAMLVAHPGSGSQRNAQRHGFQIAYSRLKWRLG